MPEPVWKRIYNTELAKLRNNFYVPGKPFASVNTLAEKYGVSTITTRRVLSELAQAGAVRNIPRKGSIVVGSGTPAVPIYLLSPQKLSSSRDALVVSRCMKGLFEESVLKKIEITPVTFEYLLERKEKTDCVFISHYSATPLPVEAMLEMLPGNMMPVVIGAPARFAKGIAVGSDGAVMMEGLLKEMKKLHCRRIGYCGNTGGPHFLRRFQAYLQYLKQENIPFQTELLLNDPERLQDDGEIKKFVEQGKIDGICCPRAEHAALVSQALKQLKLTLPVGGIGLPEADTDWICAVADYEETGRIALRQAERIASQSESRPAFLTVPFQIQSKGV